MNNDYLHSEAEVGLCDRQMGEQEVLCIRTLTLD